MCSTISISEFDLPAQERVEWKGADGVTVEGLLSYPLGYQQGRRYPLVVQSHGGMANADEFSFGAWSDYIPILAAKGYAVLKTNYRGSGGYGDAFQRDMIGHYFKNSHLDVMAGADHVIAMGVADPDRLIKRGWSAGGYMTNKIITFTNRFKAASSGAGMVNWISFYSQSDVRYFRTAWLGGTPWQPDAPIDTYWDQSPLKYIANVKTPTVIFVGESDVRVPPPQSVELYRALKSNGDSDPALSGAAGAAWLDRASPSALQDERRTGVVREIRDGPTVHLGDGAGGSAHGPHSNRRSDLDARSSLDCAAGSSIDESKAKRRREGVLDTKAASQLSARLTGGRERSVAGCSCVGRPSRAARCGGSPPADLSRVRVGSTAASAPQRPADYCRHAGGRPVGGVRQPRDRHAAPRRARRVRHSLRERERRSRR